MALYIVMSDKSDRLWYIGQKNPVDIREIESVVEVQADGDELKHVLINGKNIPYMSHIRVHNWYGDIAKMIAANLV